jgi:hypothetical protein
VKRLLSLLTRRGRRARRLTVALSLAILGLSAQSAAAADVNLAPHSFAGPAWNAQSWAVSIERSDITVPSSPPAGAVTGWLMAESFTPFRYTQVGFLWQPNYRRMPLIFAYSAWGNQGGQGTYAFGPAVQPGSTITVQLVRSGQLWLDEAWINGRWDVMQSYAVPGTPIAYEEAYGPAEQVCFTGALNFIPSVGWEPLPSACVG